MIRESSLILGLPPETLEPVRDTPQLAKIYDADWMHFLIIAPWPCAELYDELEPYVAEIRLQQMHPGRDDHQAAKHDTRRRLRRRAGLLPGSLPVQNADVVHLSSPSAPSAGQRREAFPCFHTG